MIRHFRHFMNGLRNFLRSTFDRPFCRRYKTFDGQRQKNKRQKSDSHISLDFMKSAQEQEEHIFVYLTIASVKTD